MPLEAVFVACDFGDTASGEEEVCCDICCCCLEVDEDLLNRPNRDNRRFDVDVEDMAFSSGGGGEGDVSGGDCDASEKSRICWYGCCCWGSEVFCSVVGIAGGGKREVS